MTLHWADPIYTPSRYSCMPVGSSSVQQDDSGGGMEMHQVYPAPPHLCNSEASQAPQHFLCHLERSGDVWTPPHTNVSSIHADNSSTSSNQLFDETQVWQISYSHPTFQKFEFGFKSCIRVVFKIVYAACNHVFFSNTYPCRKRMGMSHPASSALSNFGDCKDGGLAYMKTALHG